MQREIRAHKIAIRWFPFWPGQFVTRFPMDFKSFQSNDDWAYHWKGVYAARGRFINTNGNAHQSFQTEKWVLFFVSIQIQIRFDDRSYSLSAYRETRLREQRNIILIKINLNPAKHKGASRHLQLYYGQTFTWNILCLWIRFYFAIVEVTSCASGTRNRYSSSIRLLMKSILCVLCAVCVDRYWAI